MGAVPRRRHWESIYRTKGEDELSWHQDAPTLSLRLIEEVANPGTRIIDIGGGTSPLAARLLEKGFRRVSVLDIADSAVRLSQAHLGPHVGRVRWMRADVTKIERLGRFDIWHDRAVFHFLTSHQDRRAYIDLSRRTVPIGGYLILATFALDGPGKCSGLEVVRYDAPAVAKEFSTGFELLRELPESHRTPWGDRQSFSYFVLRRVRSR
ncbi:MAG: class I SAM-dependent methyltransferase [Thermoplasmata archaeon]